MAHVFNHAMLYVSLGLIEKEQHLDFFWFYAISYVHYGDYSKAELRNI